MRVVSLVVFVAAVVVLVALVVEFVAGVVCLREWGLVPSRWDRVQARSVEEGSRAYGLSELATLSY